MSEQIMNNTATPPMPFLVSKRRGMLCLCQNKPQERICAFVEDAALRMHRTGGPIDPVAICQEAGIAESDVRRLIKRAVDQGAIPAKAEIA